jgi:type III restriction enzyme
VIEGTGSTEGVVFQTAKRCYATKKSPLSHALIDSDWEQQVAIELDENPNVVSWVKTDRIGFSIPYTHQGINHGYRPDFIVRVKARDGGIVNLVLEVKGRERAPEADKRQAAKRWVEAMNYLHTQTKGAEHDMGTWAYLFVKDEQRYLVRNHLNDMAEGKAWPDGSTGYGRSPDQAV